MSRRGPSTCLLGALAVATLAACTAPEPPRGAPRPPTTSTTTVAPSTSTTTVVRSTSTTTTTTVVPSTSTTTSTVPPDPDGTIVRITQNPGGEGDPGTSFTPVISGDGEYVAFVSSANLVGDDHNGQADIHVWDAGSGTIVRLTDDIYTDSYGPAISADGRYVAFDSLSGYLVPGDSNGKDDVFLWDATTGTTVRITDGRDWSKSPSISADGRRIVFTSADRYLVPDDTNGRPDVFLWDAETGTTTRVTDTEHGLDSGAVISADGRFVAYAEYVFDGSDGTYEIFVWDSVTGTTTQIIQGDDYSGHPAISADGRFVAFYSQATNLIPGETSEPGVFVWDATTGALTRIAAGGRPTISADGRYVAFAGPTEKPVPDPDSTGFVTDVFVWDATTTAITRITDGDNFSSSPSISADGNAITFTSQASDLVDGDTNGAQDVFVWRRGG